VGVGRVLVVDPDGDDDDGPLRGAGLALDVPYSPLHATAVGNGLGLRTRAASGWAAELPPPPAAPGERPVTPLAAYAAHIANLPVPNDPLASDDAMDMDDADDEEEVGEGGMGAAVARAAPLPLVWRGARGADMLRPGDDLAVGDTPMGWGAGEGGGGGGGFGGGGGGGGTGAGGSGLVAAWLGGQEPAAQFVGRLW
jgi:hypothetical protein